MTSINLFINETQQIGPLHVWPLKVTGVSSHPYAVAPFGDKLTFRLTVLKVGTLAEAKDRLAALASGTPPTKLAQCTK